MGHSSSSTKGVPKKGKVKMTVEEHAIFKKLCWSMPPYSIEQFEVTQERVDLAAASWRYAMSGEADIYQKAKLKDASVTPLVFFYNQFYYLLFELMPEAKPLFSKGIKAQGRMLANVIKYIITNLRESDELKVKHALEHLARVHNAIGVTADAFSLMGIILVQTMRICTGPKYWTDAHKQAWVHIYSKMMSVIIPVVISGERPNLDNVSMYAVEYKKVNLNPEADNSQTHSANSDQRSFVISPKNYVVQTSTTNGPKNYQQIANSGQHITPRASVPNSLPNRPLDKLPEGHAPGSQIGHNDIDDGISGNRYGEKEEPEGLVIDISSITAKHIEVFDPTSGTTPNSPANGNDGGYGRKCSGGVGGGNGHGCPMNSKLMTYPTSCEKSEGGGGGGVGLMTPSTKANNQDTDHIFDNGCPMSGHVGESDPDPNLALLAALEQNVKDHLETLRGESTTVTGSIDETSPPTMNKSSIPPPTISPISLTAVGATTGTIASPSPPGLISMPARMQVHLRSIGVDSSTNLPPLGSLSGEALLALLQSDESMLNKNFLFKL